jgi:phosphohistidine phosphatase
MAQQLWFLRHGEAEPHGARPDPERRLTPRGEEQSRAAGGGQGARGGE